MVKRLGPTTSSEEAITGCSAAPGATRVAEAATTAAFEPFPSLVACLLLPLLPQEASASAPKAAASSGHRPRKQFKPGDVLRNRTAHLRPASQRSARIEI